MGNNYYYVTATGPVFAGQGINLHGTPQGGMGGQLSNDGVMSLGSPFDGPGDEFDCECAEIDRENGHYESEPFTFQVIGHDMTNSDSGLSQTFSVNDVYGTEDSQCYFLQDEQNPGATWVEGPPGGATFDNISGSEMVDFNESPLGPLDSASSFALPQYQTYVEAAPQIDSLQIPNQALG
ncbi:hypothetical protein KC345_g7072 [Hortaea werneckii]|nr:hypothetical protein KC345_g7072 [Hortaea werneckii]